VRRVAAALIVAGGLAGAGGAAETPAASSTPAPAAEASAFIEAVAQQVFALLRHASRTPGEREARLRELARQSFDVEGITRFLAGRAWRGANPEERQEFSALLERQLADRVVGLDTDAGRLAEGRTAAGTLPISFQAADARTCAIPHCDTVLLIDVLYQLETEAQSALVRRAAAAARASVILRAFDPARGWRSAVNRLSEAVCYALALKRSPVVNPCPLPWLVGLLERQGFDVELRPC
jgi:hypothetical protein